MVLTPTSVTGVQVIELAPLVDERGVFAVAFSCDVFNAHGLNPHVEQINLSFNPARGTLRGLHYQLAPYEEAKVVRCMRGAAHDVVVDLRPDSPTYCQWFGVDLNEEKRLTNADLEKLVETRKSRPAAANLCTAAPSSWMPNPKPW